MKKENTNTRFYPSMENTALPFYVREDLLEHLCPLVRPSVRKENLDHLFSLINHCRTTVYFVKADDTSDHPSTKNKKYKDKDKDTDKYNYKDKDGDKVQIGSNMCYIFEKHRAQGCQI